jgi:hypothetical protein
MGTSIPLAGLAGLLLVCSGEPARAADARTTAQKGDKAGPERRLTRGADAEPGLVRGAFRWPAIETLRGTAWVPQGTPRLYGSKTLTSPPPPPRRRMPDELVVPPPRPSRLARSSEEEHPAVVALETLVILIYLQAEGRAPGGGFEGRLLRAVPVDHEARAHAVREGRAWR